MKNTARPRSTSAWPMARAMCVFPRPAARRRARSCLGRSPPERVSASLPAHRAATQGLGAGASPATGRLDAGIEHSSPCCGAKAKATPASMPSASRQGRTLDDVSTEAFMCNSGDDGWLRSHCPIGNLPFSRATALVPSIIRSPAHARSGRTARWRRMLPAFRLRHMCERASGMSLQRKGWGTPTRFARGTGGLGGAQAKWPAWQSFGNEYGRGAALRLDR